MPDGKNEAKNSTMNLTIDMGNTRVKYAVFDGGTVVSDGCSEEFDEAVIDRILAAHPGITQAIVATTRGPVDDTVALVRRLRNRGVYRPAVSGNRCVVDNFYRRGCKILC